MVHRAVMDALGELAHDDAVLKETDEIASKWLADPASVDPDLAATAVGLASRHAGLARLDALRAVVKNAKTDEDRVTALRALGGFDDPKLLTAALDLVLTDEIRVHDMRYVLQSALSRRRARSTTETWVRAHWDALRKRLQGPLGHVLLRGAGNTCSTAGVAERRTWYDAHAADMPGSARALAEIYESGTLCAELRAHDKVAFDKALKSR